MLKNSFNIKRLKWLTLSIAVFSFINSQILRYLMPFVFATHRQDDWDYYKISSMNYNDLIIWREDNPLWLVSFFLIPFSFLLFISMCICYIRLKKNKTVIKIPYYALLGVQMFLGFFAITAKLITFFGVFWGMILVFLILTIVELKKLK